MWTVDGPQWAAYVQASCNVPNGGTILPPVPPPPAPPPPAPPAPPPPEAPPPETQPPPDCNTQDWSNYFPPFVFPPPGSAQFCAYLTALDSTALLFVDQIRNWVKDNITAAQLYYFLADLPTFGPGTAGTGYIVDLLVKVLKEVIDTSYPVLNKLICLFRAALDVLASTKLFCGSNAIAVLWLLKQLMGLLSDFELGWDIAIWAVDYAHIDWDPFRKFLDMLIAWALPIEVPGVAEAIEAWMFGYIDQSLRDCVFQLNGLCPSMYEKYAMARSERLTGDEALRFAHRFNLSDQETDDYLKNHGWRDDNERQAKQQLFWELPTIQDHLHWLSRNVDDIDYVEHFGLLDGFAPDEFIHNLPGFEGYATVTDIGRRNFWGAFGNDLLAQGMKPVYAAYHYAAHWIQPSPEQMKEFIYRLRPDPALDERGFTIDDFRRILREQDYAPLAIDWFSKTAFRVPALTYVISMYRYHVISDAELAGYHQDLGYTRQDSERFVAVDRLQRNKMRASEYAGWNPASIATAFVVGKLDVAQVKAKMAALGATDDETIALMETAELRIDRMAWSRARSRVLSRTAMQVSRALDVGVMTDEEGVAILAQIGYPQDKAQAVVELERSVSRTKIVGQTVAAVRRSLHDGFITPDVAVALLQQTGINPQKTQEYLALWTIQNTPRRKRRTASQIVTDVANAMMPVEEALFRLANLGYDNADQMLYLADAQRKIVAMEAKALAAANRDARVRAQQSARLAKEAKRQAQELRSEAIRSAPRSILVKWLRRGEIRIPEFRSRMSIIGVAPVDTERYLVDAPLDPKIADLQKWVKDGLISETQFIERAVGFGYSRSDAIYYYRDASKPKAAKGKAPASGQAGTAGSAGGAAPAP